MQMKSSGSIKELIEVNKLQLVFEKIEDRSIHVSRDVIYQLLQRCSKDRDLVGARKVYDLLVSNQLDFIPSLVDHTIRLFTCCGSLPDANMVFHNFAKPTIYTWNAIIQANANLGEGLQALKLFEDMLKNGIKPEKHTFSSVLKACSTTRLLDKGRLIHDLISRNAFELDSAVGNALVSMYAKCGSLAEARRIFEKLYPPNVVSWAAMISGYVRHGEGLLANELYKKMQMSGTKPDKVIFLCALQSCSSTGAINLGRLIHQQLIENGLDAENMIGNAVIDMYGKCGTKEDADSLFYTNKNRDVVTWGALIAGYSHQGDTLSALKAFYKMQNEGFSPDQLVFSSVIKVCRSLSYLVQGRLAHDQICQFGLESDLVIGSTLVDMYAACGKLDETQQVFDSLPQHDLLLWGAIITAFLEHGYVSLAFEYYYKMLMEGLIPENTITLSILRASGNAGALEYTCLLHHQIVTDGLESEKTIGNTLVDVYAKCGGLNDALHIFKTLPSRTVVSWGALITAYAKLGHWRLALEWFEDFKRQPMKPDDIIFLGVLLSCSHVGLVEDGSMYFRSMEQEHGIKANIEHYNCLIDLLGRSGRLSEAEDLLKSLPPGEYMIGWTSLLAGSETYGNRELARKCHERITQLDSSHASSYVIMSTMHADVYY